MSFHSPRPSIFSFPYKVAVTLSRFRSVQTRSSDLNWKRSFSSRGVTLQKEVPFHRTGYDQAKSGLLSETINDDARSFSHSPQVPIGNGDAHSVTSSSQDSASENTKNLAPGVRRPRALQAIFLRPLKRKAEYGVPACDLQLRSYGPRNVEFFADFALRAAYYLGLPASGPIPLPRITERWTVPRSNFIFKKSQENFERITFRRLIQIQDANTESVEIWLAFLRTHAYYGVGMKANVWQHEKLGVGKTMDVNLENLRSSLDPAWAHFGRRKTLETSEKAYQMIKDEIFETTEKVANVPG